MALTDEQLLDAALEDLDRIEKTKLRSLLNKRLAEINARLKKQKSGKDFVTTGTGIQPEYKPGQPIYRYQSLQDEKDDITRRLIDIETSLKPKETIIEKELPGTEGAAYGGMKYVLQGEDEEEGIVQLFDPKTPVGDDGTRPAIKTGYLIRQGVERATPKRPGETRNIFETVIVDPAVFTQQIFNEYQNDPEAVMAEKKRLIAAKFLPPGTVVDGEVDAAFRAAMTNLAAKISTENLRRTNADPKSRLFTLDTGLDYFAQRGGIGGADKTSTSISTKDEAYATLNEALRAYLGREATQDELSQFTAQLNAFERANPTVETVTGTGTVVSGGAQGAMGRMATEFARSQEGSAAFRAGTYYYDALLDALDNPLF